MKPILAVALSLAAVAGGVFGGSMLFGAHPAAADAITITRLEDRVEIRVVDVVADPGAVEAKLEDELGIGAEMLALPVPSALVGQVTAVGNTGPVEPDIDVDAENLVELATLPEGFSGTLIIEYGRTAEPGEVYETTIADDRCVLMFGPPSPAPSPNYRPSVGLCASKPLPQLVRSRLMPTQISSPTTTNSPTSLHCPMLAIWLLSLRTRVLNTSTRVASSGPGSGGRRLHDGVTAVDPQTRIHPESFHPRPDQWWTRCAPQHKPRGQPFLLTATADPHPTITKETSAIGERSAVSRCRIGLVDRSTRSHVRRRHDHGAASTDCSTSTTSATPTSRDHVVVAAGACTQASDDAPLAAPPPSIHVTQPVAVEPSTPLPLITEPDLLEVATRDWATLLATGPKGLSTTVTAS